MSPRVIFEKGVYGRRAVLTGPWSNATEREILKHRCQEIEINMGKGWRGSDLSFLISFPDLKALTILTFNIPSVEPIHALSQLRALEVSTYCRTRLRFAAFPKLQNCILEWRPGADSLFECTTLKKLFVNRYSGTNAAGFARLKALESLAILNSPISDVEGLRALKDLRKLRLARLPKLRSLAGIDGLLGLEELEISTCRGISSIQELGKLTNLRTLFLNNDGEIASLKHLERLNKLETVIFYQSTNILDGDLTPVLHQKNLSKVSFQNRRHYSHQREEFGAAYGRA